MCIGSLHPHQEALLEPEMEDSSFEELDGESQGAASTEVRCPNDKLEKGCSLTLAVKQRGGNCQGKCEWQGSGTHFMRSQTSDKGSAQGGFGGVPKAVTPPSSASSLFAHLSCQSNADPYLTSNCRSREMPKTTGLPGSLNPDLRAAPQYSAA